MTIYLASKSPRRRQILTDLGFTVELLADISAPRGYLPGDEEVRPNELPAHYVERIAQEKLLEGLAKLSTLQPIPTQAVVLAADTAVSLDHMILGKPRDQDEAIDFLKRLSNRTHEVRTTVAVARPDGPVRLQTSCSTVHFRALTDAEILAYAQTDEPYDKAGGYGIQGLASLFIDHITGSFSGIMGLPIFETCQLLSYEGIYVPFLTSAQS